MPTAFKYLLSLGVLVFLTLLGGVIGGWFGMRGVMPGSDSPGDGIGGFLAGMTGMVIGFLAGFVGLLIFWGEAVPLYEAGLEEVAFAEGEGVWPPAPQRSDATG